MIFQAPDTFRAGWLETIGELESPTDPEVSLEQDKDEVLLILLREKTGVAKYGEIAEEGELVSGPVVDTDEVAKRVVEVVQELDQDARMRRRHPCSVQFFRPLSGAKRSVGRRLTVLSAVRGL